MTLGAAKETVATVVQSPRLAWEIIENCWQADTIGPNLKIIGTVAAVPLAALSIPAGPFYGAFQGGAAVWNARHDEDNRPLRKDAAPAFAKASFTVEEGEARTMTGNFINGLEEFGAKPLAEGEKPYDVPILSPLFAVAGGVVSAALGGVVGLATGLVAGGIMTGKEVKKAFTDEDKSVGERVIQTVLSPLNLVAGPALAWSAVKEAVPRGLSDGWKHGPFKPVIDTAKISAKLGASAVKEAWNK